MKVDWSKLRSDLVVSRTPLRISLVGGGTDFASYYRESPGSVISCAIDRYVYVSVKKHSEIFQEIVRLNYSQIELANSIEDIKNIIVRGLLQYLEFDGRLYVGTVADIPAGNGLGSSSSFAVGLLNSIYWSLGSLIGPGYLAEIANAIEIDFLKRPMGKQDAFPAAYGGLNKIVFNQDNSTSLTPIILNNTSLGALNKAMYLIYTNKLRSSHTILNDQVDRNDQGVNNNNLHQIHALVDKLHQVLIKDFSLQAIGEILNETWSIKKKLSKKISNVEFDELHKKIITSGAYGAKLLGAGGGGFFLSIVEPEYEERFKFGMRDFFIQKIQISSSGSVIV